MNAPISSSERRDSGSQRASWNTWGRSGQALTSVRTPAARARSAARRESSKSISLDETWKRSGGWPSQFPNNGEIAGSARSAPCAYASHTSRCAARLKIQSERSLYDQEGLAPVRSVTGERSTALAGRQQPAPTRTLQHGEREVATRRVPCDDDAARGEVLREQPFVSRAAVVEAGGETVLGREPVLGQQHAHARPLRELGRERQIGVRQVGAERAAVEVEDDAAPHRRLVADPPGRHAAGIGARHRQFDRVAAEPAVGAGDLVPHDVHPRGFAPPPLDRKPQDGPEDELGDHSASVRAGGIALIACSASAVIVSEGFTPGLAGTAAPSHTSRFR